MTAPERTDLFGRPVAPKVKQADLFPTYLPAPAHELAPIVSPLPLDPQTVDLFEEINPRAEP